MIYHPAAREELIDAMRWYEAHRAGLGDEFLQAVVDVEAKIAEAPNRWTEIEPGFRKLNTDRFPYGLIYQQVAGHVEIVAVMHLSRRPGYWRVRAK